MPAFRWPAPAGKDAECFRIVRCTNLLFGHPRFPRHKNRPAPLSSSFRQAMPSLIIQYKNTTKMTAEGPNHVATVGVPDRSGAQEDEQEEKQEKNTHNKQQQQPPTAAAAAEANRPAECSTTFPQRPNPYLPFLQKKRMGLKSQHAVSAVKASKKKGFSASWWKKEGRDGPPDQVCRVCEAKAAGRKVPKRAHHPKCRSSRVYKKKTTTTANMETPPPPLGVPAPPPTREHGGTAMSTGQSLVVTGSTGGEAGTHQSTTVSSTAEASLVQGGRVPRRQQDHDVGTSILGGSSTALPLGQALRNELERRLLLLRTAQAPSVAATGKDGGEAEALAKLVEARTKGVPVGVQLLFDFIHNEITMKRRSKQQSTSNGGSWHSTPLTFDQQEAMFNRRRYFHDQQCFFTFPPDPSPNPLPEYHFIEGFSIFMLDLEILLVQTTAGVPATTASATTTTSLCCSKCQGFLQRERTNWSKRKSLFPVLEQNGVFSFGSVMNYKCVPCNVHYAANDATLLLQIPPHLRRAYPVEPRFALSGFNFHLSKDVTSNLCGAMLTQGSGENVSKSLYRKSREKYTEAVTTFLSKLPDATVLQEGQILQSFPMSFNEEWCRFPPGGDQLRNYYCQGEQSEHTVYGYSNKDRYVREIQSVGSSPDENVKAVVIDWTFQALKTYKGLGTQGGKCMFTMKVVGDRGKRTAGAVIVPNTAAASISHFMINMVTKREGLQKVALIFTDEWPSASAFWADIFGHHIVGRLGLFHAIKRVTDTIERGEDWEFFNGMLYDLRLCFYEFDSDDMGNVVAALTAGTMTKDKHRYTAKEIEAFRKTPDWNRRFSRHIRKCIYKGPLIAQKLEEFRMKYQDLHDGNGKKRFTKETSKAIDDLLKKVHHVGDLPDQFTPYREIPAGPNSTHGLPSYESLRPESTLEKFHHTLAHFGNLGMSKDLADTILLRGIAEDNVRIEHQRGPKNPDIPSRFEDEPEYFDQSELSWLNSLGEQKGYVEIFKGARQPPVNNGEVFLSKYLDQEMKRKSKKASMDTKTNKCNCPECIGISFPLVSAGGLLTVAAPAAAGRSPDIARDRGSEQNQVVVPYAAPPPAVVVAQERGSEEQNQVVPYAAPPAIVAQQMPHLLCPVPLPGTMVSWFGGGSPVLLLAPPVSERCYMFPPFYCQERWAWQCLRDAACGTQQQRQRLGAPRHNPDCPRRCTPQVYNTPFMY